MKIPVMLDNESQHLFTNKPLSDYDLNQNYNVRHSLFLHNIDDHKLNGLDNDDISKNYSDQNGIDFTENSRAHEMNDICQPLENGLSFKNSYHEFANSSMLYGKDLELDKNNKDSMMMNLENGTIMTCFFCKKVFNEPRLLSCLHTFCYSCIENTIVKNYPSLALKLIKYTKEPISNGIHNNLGYEDTYLLPYKTYQDNTFVEKLCVNITCPICLHKTQIIYRNPDTLKVDLMNKLPINYILQDSITFNNLKEKVHSLVNNSISNISDQSSSTKGGDASSIVCTSCKGPSCPDADSDLVDNSAVARCLECASYLCKVCVQAHRYMRCFENHTVMTFAQIDSALVGTTELNNTASTTTSTTTMVEQQFKTSSSSVAPSSSSTSSSTAGSNSNLSSAGGGEIGEILKENSQLRNDSATNRKDKLIESLRYAVKCRQHPTEPVKLYCNTCQILACSGCQEFHQPPSHSCFPLDPNLEQKEREELTRDLSIAKSKLPVLEAKITLYQNKLTRLENQQETIKYRLKDTQEACKDMLDSYFNKMLDALSDTHSSFELKVMEAYHDVEKLCESFEDSTKFVENLLAQSTLPEILSLKPLIKARLEALSQSLLPSHESLYSSVHRLEIQLPFEARDLEDFLQSKLLDAFHDQHKTLETRSAPTTRSPEGSGIVGEVETANATPSPSTVSLPIPEEMGKVGDAAERATGGDNSNDDIQRPTGPEPDLTHLGNINPSSALANNIMGLAALAKLGNIGFDNSMLINDIGLLSQSLENGLHNGPAPVQNGLETRSDPKHSAFMNANPAVNLSNHNPAPTNRYLSNGLPQNQLLQNAKLHEAFLQGTTTDMSKQGLSSLLSLPGSNNLPSPFNHEPLQQHHSTQLINHHNGMPTNNNNLASNLSRLLTLSASCTPSSLLPTPSNSSMFNEPPPPPFNHPQQHSSHPPPGGPNSSLALLNSVSHHTNNPPMHPSLQGFNSLQGSSSSHLHAPTQSPLDVALLSPGMFMNSPPPAAPFGMNYVPPMRSGDVNKMSIMKVRVKFGSLGPGNLQFNSPHGFCLGMDEEIIVADTNNHRIQVYSKSGAFKGQFGIPGRDEGQLWYPRKVAVNKINGKFIVCDRGNERSRMQIFDRNGNFLKKVPIRYIDIVAGLAITEVGSPGGAGHIVAVDSVSPTVFRIAESGDLLHWFDCSEHMREPSDVAVRADEYYVCDFKGHCVAVFAESGQFLRRIGRESLTNFPNGIDVSEGGEVLVGDSHGNRFHVAVFRGSDGTFLAEFECPHVKVSRCCGLKITSEGYVVTLAKNNHYVLVLDTLFVPP